MNLVVFEGLDDGGVVRSRTYSRLIIRYICRYEMRHLLELRGFRTDALYGDFERGPFCYGGEQVWIARNNCKT
ncbi:MAG: hypothetical protein HYY30_10940 [Chloroflexi bacterium]|nr:hypothetical protein [Chloroflexota bacterium]